MNEFQRERLLIGTSSLVIRAVGVYTQPSTLPLFREGLYCSPRPDEQPLREIIAP
jgi:hypothetical protein